MCRLSASVMEGSTVLYAAEVRPSQQRQGVHEVSFKPVISGVYGLALCLEGGRHLKGSPFYVRAKTDETVAGNCKMYGAGLTRAVAGQATTFTIQGMHTFLMHERHLSFTAAIHCTGCTCATVAEIRPTLIDGSMLLGLHNRCSSALVACCRELSMNVRWLSAK